MTERARGVGGAMAGTSSSSAWPARLLAVGVACALLAHLPGLFTRGDVLRSVVFAFLAAVAVAFGLLAPGGPRPSRPVSLLLLLPVLVPLAALVATVDPSGVDALRHAAVWVALAALASGLVRTWRGGHDVQRAWAALVVAGALAGAVTVLLALFEGLPAAGPFGRPGIAGPVLAALLPATLLLPRVHVAWRLLVSALVTGGLVVTLSRTGYVAAALGLLAALAFVTHGRRRRAAGAALAAAALVAGLGLALAATGHLRVPGGGTTFEVRLGLWKATSTLVAERPVAGHGLGSFPAEVLRVRDVHEAGISRGRRALVAHNDYLHVAAEGGLLASLALVVFVGGVLGLAVLRTRARPDADADTQRLVAIAGASFATLAVAALAEDVLLDPAGALVAAVAAATLATAFRSAGRGGRLLDVAVGLVGLVALGAAGVKARDMLADVHVRAYRDTIRDGVSLGRAEAAARRHLKDGALAWRPDHAEAWYRLGVHRAELRNYAGAREAWERALAADAGRTEAWLDIARSYEREGQPEDAKVALLAARRRDPTRYDVHVRLGHLALGDEPVPGERWTDSGRAIAAHRHYNEAERCGPGRFETHVARARIARRLGRLQEAAALLQQANELEEYAGETILESFRLEDVERKAGELGAAGILGLALVKAPHLAAGIRVEVERFLALGEERERAARATVAGSLDPPDYAATDRAFSAAARRLAGLVHGGASTPADVLAQAERDETEKAWRRALASYRALLSRASLEEPKQGIQRAEQLDTLTELLLRAAKVATRVDGALARGYYAEGHETRDNAEAAWEDVRGALGRAASTSPRDGVVRVDLARARLRTGDVEGAEEALLEALEIEPALKGLVEGLPDLEELLSRPALRERMR